MTINDEIKDLIAYQEKVKLHRRTAMKTYSDKNREKIREINKKSYYKRKEEKKLRESN
tara:strand:- start:558 stop:731 length:174 start_codon:yes stop_codon:yes gene_type:complete